MPRGFHFNSIKNPIRIFLVSNEVVCDAAPDITLDVDGGAGLQFLTDLVVAAGIDNCVDVHMTCEMGRQLVAISCEKIENAGRKVTRRDDFGKGKGGERIRVRGGALPAFRLRDTKFGPANKGYISSNPELRFVPPGPHRENLFGRHESN